MSVVLPAALFVWLLQIVELVILVVLGLEEFGSEPVGFEPAALA